LDNIVLETDCPYLAPVPHRGKRNEPAYIPLIAKKIAELKKVTLEELSHITVSNSMKLFNDTYELSDY
jgi:TatD DNase family protein